MMELLTTREPGETGAQLAKYRPLLARDVPEQSAALSAAFHTPGADELLARTTLAFARSKKQDKAQEFYEYTMRAIKPRGGPTD
jgi:hypothetical protein